VPEPARQTLQQVRSAIRLAAPPEAVERLHYGMPAFSYKGALVSYAAFKNHCSLFPMQASLLDDLGEEMKRYRSSKGTLQFPLDEPLPAALVRKIVEARVAANNRKHSG